MRRVLTAAMGFATGFFFSNIPAVIEWALRLPMCRESCPEWFTVSFIGVYFAMPVVWAALFALTIGNSRRVNNVKVTLAAASVSMIVMFVIAFFAYAHQVRLL